MKLPAKVVVVLLLAAVPAHGQVRKGDKLLPPLRYDVPYEGKIYYRVGKDEAEMLILCPRQPPFGYPRLACSYHRAGECAVFLASDEMIRGYGLDPEVALRHEIGHCNGWPQSHEGAR